MFTLKIDTDNAAFSEDPGYEVASILKKIVQKLERGETEGVAMDTNGNKVGRWELEESVSVTDMSKATDILKLVEELSETVGGLDPATQKLADQISDALIKNFGSYRKSETGNESGKMYKVVTDKNWNKGAPVAMFRIPVITIERGQSTRETQGNAVNSLKNFDAVFDKIWGLRDKGWLISQPRGGYQEGDGWENKEAQTSGTILQFALAAPQQPQQQ